MTFVPSINKKKIIHVYDPNKDLTKSGEGLSEQNTNKFISKLREPTPNLVDKGDMVE